MRTAFWSVNGDFSEIQGKVLPHPLGLSVFGPSCSFPSTQSKSPRGPVPEQEQSPAAPSDRKAAQLADLCIRHT